MQSEFEKYLKNSDYLRDVLNTHRAGTAEVVAALLRFLVENEHVSMPAVRQFLKGLEDSTSGPSIDGERRRIVALIQDALNRHG